MPDQADKTLAPIATHSKDEVSGAKVLASQAPSQAPYQSPKTMHTLSTPQTPQIKPSKWRRIAWFIGLWAVSVGAIMIVSKLIQWAIVP